MSQHNKKTPPSRSVHRYHFPTLPAQGILPEEQPYDSPQQVAARYQALMEEGREAGFAEGLRHGLEQGQQQGQQLGQERGFKVGLQEGLEAGSQQAYAECKPRLDEALFKADQLYHALDAALQETLTKQQESLCQLVSQVCRQVLRAELALKPTQILPLIEESLALLPKPQGAIAIRLDPATLVLLKEFAAEAVARWELQPDPRLSPGSFHIQTGLAEAESLLDERVELCVDQLRRQLASAPEPEPEQEAPARPPLDAIPDAAADTTTLHSLPWRQEDKLPDLALPMDGFSDEDFRA